MNGYARPVAVAALVAILVAVAGGTITQIGPWYEGLAKPSWTPPNWAFGPAWTLIFSLAVVAAARGWRHAEGARARAWLISLFAANAVLNVLWSLFFFGLKRPDWALAEVITLWISVAALIVFLRRRDLWAAFALLPYLIWVAYAAAVNARVVVLNGPFGS